MREKVGIFSIVLFFIVFNFLISCKQQKSEWQGTIEEVDGVTVVRNPDEPYYGELIFNLEEDLIIGREDDENFQFYRAYNLAVDNEDNIYVVDSGNKRIQKFDKNGNYIQTIGRKGQGPGEFESLSEIFIDGSDIYASDNRKIEIFDIKGEHKDSISLRHPISNFSVTPDGHIVAFTIIRVDEEKKEAVVKIDSMGKITKNLVEFAEAKAETRRGRSGSYSTFTIKHSYTPQLCFAPINDKNFAYSHSSQYEIFFMNENGVLKMKIIKEEKPHSISSEEKDVIISRVKESISRLGRKWPDDVVKEACSFPSHRPYIRGILTDDKERYYVLRVSSVLDKKSEREYDIFNNEGYYLYRAKIPVYPVIIKKGLIYNIKTEETGEVFVRRFRITNWNQIKEGIN